MAGVAGCRVHLAVETGRAQGGAALLAGLQKTYVSAAKYMGSKKDGRMCNGHADGICVHRRPCL